MVDLNAILTEERGDFGISKFVLDIGPGYAHGDEYKIEKMPSGIYVIIREKYHIHAHESTTPLNALLNRGEAVKYAYDSAISDFRSIWGNQTELDDQTSLNAV